MFQPPGSIPFNPSQLFAALQGAWLEPKQGYIWQENTGITPTTTGGQTIGLMLDQSQGAVLGPQLVTNGDFNGATGWTNDSAGGWATVTDNGGSITVAGTPPSGSTNFFLINSSAITVVAGKTYEITVTRTGNVTGSPELYLYNATATSVFSGAISFQGKSTTQTYRYLSQTNVLYLHFAVFGTSPISITLDSVSVKQILGNHAYQSTAANRPVLGRRYNLLTFSEQFDAIGWAKNSNGTGSAPVVTPNDATAPDGTLTADKVVFNSGAGTSTSDQSVLNYATGTATIGRSYTGSVYIKGSAGTNLNFRHVGAAGYYLITLTGGWDRISNPETAAISTIDFSIGIRQGVNGTINSSATVWLWGADLRLTADVGKDPTYQRITTATDYDYGQYPAAIFDTNDFLSLSLPAINVRRNLSLWTENFSSTYGLNQFVTYYADQELAPDGTSTADLLVETTDNNQHRHGHYTTISVTAGQTYTASVYVKRASGTRNVILRIDIGTNNFGSSGTLFNLTTFAITPSAGQSGAIIPLSNGWSRISITATSSATYSPNFGVSVLMTSGTLPTDTTYTGDGTSGIYIWGAQLELGSVATDYQKVTDWTSEAFASSGSVYFSTPVGMSQLNNQSMGATYTLPALSSDIYSWMVFPQRLNTAQESRLAQYMQQKAGIAGPDYFDQVDYGPELVVNGDFSNGTTGWKGSADGTNQDDSILSITSGALRITNNTAGNITPRVRQTSIVTVATGKSYVVSLRVVSNPNNVPLALTYSASDTPSGFGVTGNAATGTSGTLAATFVAYSSSYLSPGLRLNSSVLQPGQYVEIDNISVRELKDGVTGQLSDDAGDLIFTAQ